MRDHSMVKGRREKQGDIQIAQLIRNSIRGGAKKATFRIPTLIIGLNSTPPLRESLIRQLPPPHRSSYLDVVLLPVRFFFSLSSLSSRYFAFLGSFFNYLPTKCARSFYGTLNLCAARPPCALWPSTVRGSREV